MTDFSFEHLLNNNQYSQLNLGTALASSTSATDISPGGLTPGQAFTLPASYLQIGQQYRASASGIVSNTGTPTLTLGLYYGGVAGTALGTTGAVTTSSGLSNSIWRLTVEFRVESVGTGGSIRSLGSVTGIAASPSMIPGAGSSSGNLVSSLDTSAAKILTVGATWGTSSASNSIQVVFFTIERLNEGSS